VLSRGPGILAAAALAAAGILAVPGSAQAALPGASSLLTRAPYLSDLTTSSVQVSWGTATRSAGVVEYGPPGNCTAHSVTAAPGSAIVVHGVTEYQNSVAVTGLSASASYCYRVTTGGSAPVDLLGTGASPQFTALQPANGSGPLIFDVLDDWGDTTNSGVNNGQPNANQIGVDAQIAGSSARFAISIGDVAYQDGSQTNYGDLNQTGPYVSGVFGPSYWAVPGPHIPVFAGVGDHDQNPTSLSIWPETATAAPAASNGVYSAVSYPSIDGSKPAKYATGYYAFSTGGVRFYVLDASWGYSNIGTATGGSCGAAHCAMYQVDRDAHWTPSSAEYQWLAADLAAHPGGMKFAFFHFPLYSDDATEPDDKYLDNLPGSSGSLEQLLHDNGVQLAFTGHAHIYPRNIATPGGVTSYVTGGGGAQSTVVAGHGCETTDAYAVGWSNASHKGSACGAAAKPTADSQVYHFLKVTVNGTTVTVTPTDSQGVAFDVHSYNFAPDSTPPSAPGSLTAAQPKPPSVVLKWTPATDNIGVSAYDIYRNGTYLATAGPGVTSYTDTTAVAGVSYTYSVVARDLAGNTTGASVTAGGGAPLFSDGFESGNLSRWTTVSGMTVKPGPAHSGSYAAWETGTATPAYAYKTLPGDYRQLWAQAWVDVQSQGTSVSLFGFRNATAASIVDVYLNASGMLSLRNNIGLVTTYSTTKLPPGEWHRITLHAIVNGTASSVDVSLDGTEVPGLTLTGQNFGTEPIASLKLGEILTGRTYGVAFDDLAVTEGPPSSSPRPDVGSSR
jgi:hypothetical protein